MFVLTFCYIDLRKNMQTYPFSCKVSYNLTRRALKDLHFEICKIIDEFVKNHLCNSKNNKRPRKEYLSNILRNSEKEKLNPYFISGTSEYDKIQDLIRSKYADYFEFYITKRGGKVFIILNTSAFIANTYSVEFIYKVAATPKGLELKYLKYGKTKNIF